MKSIRTFLLFVLVITSILLSACSGISAASSWPGVVASQDTAYVAYTPGVFAINLSDGSLAWRYPPDKADNTKQFFAPPTVAGNLIVAGDYANILYGLDAKKGTLTWSFTGATNRWIGGALFVNNLILAPNADNNLYALNLNGSLQWTFKNSVHALWSQPITDGKTVFVSSTDHNVYDLQISNGQKIWSTDVGGSILGSPTLNQDNSVLYVGTLGGQVVALDAASGKILWRFSAAGEIWGSPVFNKDVVYIGDRSNSVYAIDAKTGKSIWKVDVGSNVIGSGAIAQDGVIFVTEGPTTGTAAGQIYDLSFANGQKLWSQTINGKLYTTPVTVGDKILIGVTSGDNLLTELDAKGNKIWSYAVPK
ncbi:MAG: PQQ-binding-like beta-propeller repeat protein [Anaerolineaceae bacterium]|nr:PQQ-binding-like beta-propeller repeat protein [Anaerolineaceae bacterium]